MPKLKTYLKIRKYTIVLFVFNLECKRISPCFLCAFCVFPFGMKTNRNEERHLCCKIVYLCILHTKQFGDETFSHLVAQKLI